LESLNNTNSQHNEHRSIIHIDRLNLTFRHTCFSAFKNIRNPDAIPERQKFGSIELILDNRCGSNAYYHTFGVYHNGKKVGKLHTGSKMGKPDIEFDYDKQVHYSVACDWWFSIYKSIKLELGLEYNNINYIEICVDSTMNFPDMYGYMNANSVTNKYRFNDFFKPLRNSTAEVLNGGNGFRIPGSNNSIHIYNKSNHTEDFINDFFKANNLGDKTVYRLECRLNWNYLKSLISRKEVLITPEVLLDENMLSMLFLMSVKNKLTFKDLRTKHRDKSGNAKYNEVSILDNICLNKSELLKFNPGKQHSHYKNESTDEDIIRRTYYAFLETGNEKYFNNIRHNAEAAMIDDSTVIALLHKFNQKYRGDRTTDVLNRMEFAVTNYRVEKKGGIIDKIIGLFGANWRKKPKVFVTS
jgi:hypothetical protein